MYVQHRYVCNTYIYIKKAYFVISVKHNTKLCTYFVNHASVTYFVITYVHTPCICVSVCLCMCLCCAYICVYVCVLVFVFFCVFVYACVFMCVLVFVFVYVHVCMCVPVWVIEWVNEWVSVWICIWVYDQTYGNQAYIHMCIPHCLGKIQHMYVHMKTICNSSYCPSLKLCNILNTNHYERSLLLIPLANVS